MPYELVLFKNIVDPRVKEIDRYIELGGYKAAEKVVKEITPKDVIETTKATGLRGRGGAGFPTGLKWSFVPKDTGKPIYLCCNADESEPGTCKDRVIIERDPHQLIEGIIIAAYAVDCHLAFIYLRGEFSLGYSVLDKALQEARARGFLGGRIFGSGYDLEIVLHQIGDEPLVGIGDGHVNRDREGRQLEFLASRRRRQQRKGCDGRSQPAAEGWQPGAGS